MAGGERRRLRLTLVISSLDCGGAERVMSLLANALSVRSHQVTLVTLTSVDGEFYNLDCGISRCRLRLDNVSSNLFQGMLSNFHRIIVLRKVIQKTRPDCVISFVDRTNILTIISLLGCRIPTVISERTDPREYDIGRYWSLARRLVYPCASGLVIQTEATLQWGAVIMGKRPVWIVPNPVVTEGEASLEIPLPLGNIVAAMGRLTKTKGFDLLLAAFAQIAPRFPDWSVLILGEGEERESLALQARELKIAGRVSLPGRVTCPRAVLARTQIFVLSSRLEGFPNALLEAMACGLAVIATDCNSGPAHIIQQGINGILVPKEDVAALSGAMENLMQSPETRTALGGCARLVRERFALEAIVSLWENVIGSSAAIEAGSKATSSEVCDIDC